MCELLLQKGATVNHSDKRDRRPLHWAASRDHDDVARLLLRRGLVLRRGRDLLLWRRLLLQRGLVLRCGLLQRGLAFWHGHGLVLLWRGYLLRRGLLL